MKVKFFFTVLLALSSIVAQSQIVTIPDPNFKSALIDEGVDTNNDGEIQVSEAEAISQLSVSDYNISSLVGIESFINIQQLSCENNMLTSLDVSQNTSLQTLWCRFNMITTLDVTGCTQLATLICTDNQISTIDLSFNPNLYWMDLSFNELVSLDVTQNPALNLFICLENNLTNLDLTQNTNLDRVFLNNNQLTQLDVSNSPGITQLFCSENQLSSLDVSQNPILSNLGCFGNSITHLDLTQNPEISSLSCENNQLESLDLRNGNNSGILRMFAIGNPNLLCIQVDDVSFANAQICDMTGDGSGWCKDGIAEYSKICELGVEDLRDISFSLVPNPTGNLLQISTDLEVQGVVIYSANGTKVLELPATDLLDLSSLASGLYFAQVVSVSGISTQKFIKY